MIFGLPSYIDYFRQLADEHQQIASFVVGSSERVLRRQHTDITYPLIWLIWPDMEVLDDESERFTADLVVLIGTENDEDEENAALLDAYNICLDIHKRMKNDANDGLFGYSGGTSFQPKFRFTGDNDAGYVMEASLTLGTSGCLDSGKFNR